MVRSFIAQKLGMYAKKLGMGIASHANGDISRKTRLFFVDSSFKVWISKNGEGLELKTCV